MSSDGNADADIDNDDYAEDINDVDAGNNDMDTDGSIEVDINTDSHYGDAIDEIKDEDENDGDEAQSFINKEKGFKDILCPIGIFYDSI